MTAALTGRRRPVRILSKFVIWLAKHPSEKQPTLWRLERAPGRPAAATVLLHTNPWPGGDPLRDAKARQASAPTQRLPRHVQHTSGNDRSNPGEPGPLLHVPRSRSTSISSRSARYGERGSNRASRRPSRRARSDAPPGRGDPAAGELLDLRGRQAARSAGMGPAGASRPCRARPRAACPRRAPSWFRARSPSAAPCRAAPGTLRLARSRTAALRLLVADARAGVGLVTAAGVAVARAGHVDREQTRGDDRGDAEPPRSTCLGTP